MAKHTEKTNPVRRAKIFEVEEAHVSYLEDVIAHSSFSGGRDTEQADPNLVGARAGRSRLRQEFDAIWRGR